MKLLCGVIVLACVPLAPARNDVAYPSGKVTEFLVEKLDVTTLPSGIRPKREKGEDIRRLWVCDTEGRREGSTPRDARGGIADCHQALRTRRVWNLRLC